MSSERVSCYKCGNVVCDRTGESIIIIGGTVKYDICGSVKIVCSCGNVFRKSAGFLRVIPMIEKWVQDGIAARLDEQPKPKESEVKTDNPRGTVKTDEQPAVRNRQVQTRNS